MLKMETLKQFGEERTPDKLIDRLIQLDEPALIKDSLQFMLTRWLTLEDACSHEDRASCMNHTMLMCEFLERINVSQPKPTTP